MLNVDVLRCRKYYWQNFFWRKYLDGLFGVENQIVKIYLSNNGQFLYCFEERVDFVNRRVFYFLYIMEDLIMRFLGVEVGVEIDIFVQQGGKKF